MRSADDRSAGTRTMPARMASAGCRRVTDEPSTSISPAPGRVCPHRMSNSSSLSLPLERHDPDAPRRRGRRTTRMEVACRTTIAPRAAARVGVRTSRLDASPASGVAAPDAAAGPSMSLTISSSAAAPSARMSTTPTVLPSRRTVARSHSPATSSIRWEMKMTERDVPRWLATTCEHPGREVRRQRGRHLSRSRTSGSMASARARSTTRKVASGRSRAGTRRSRPGRPRSAIRSRNSSIGVSVSTRVSAIGEVRE